MHTLIRIALTSFLLVLFLLHISGVLPVPLIGQIERLSYDTRVRTSQLPGIDRNVTIVDIDERSQEIEGQWPWPRSRLARLVDQLYEHYGVRAVGFDMVFPEPDRSSGARFLDRLGGSIVGELPGAAELIRELRSRWDDDRLFAAALERHQPVLGYVFKGGRDSPTRQGELPSPLFERAASLPAAYLEATYYTANLAILQQAAGSGGFFDNPTLDPDGVFRRVPLLQKYDGAVYGSLALMTLARGLGNAPIGLVYDNAGGPRTPLNLDYLALGELAMPVDEAAAVLVPYRGPHFSFPYVSATDVLTGAATGERLADRIVLIGTSAPGLKDLRTTPVGTAFNGVEIHANLISGMLDGRIKQKVPYLVGIETTMLVLIGLVLTLGLSRLSPALGSVLLFALLGVIVLASLSAWHAGDFVLPTGSPLLFAVAVFLIQTTYGFFIESRNKRAISRLFGQYVPSELVEEMAEHAEDVHMSSDSREMTVLFSDVRGFTSISEKLEPQELTELMNEFLTPLTRVIHEHRGTIDKYMGDAVMAFWGAPLPEAEHARRALEAARAMVGCMQELGERFEARGWPALKVGVGVNTGVMSVGNMGSEFRMAYTVLGDAVNLGSRLEGLTKQYGVSIICSDSTRRQVTDWLYRDLDLVRVKGKEEPISIYEPLGPRDGIPAPQREELKQYRLALQAYRHQQWDQSELQFYHLKQAGHGLKIYDIYLERIAVFRQQPPGPDWDGVFTHTSK